MVEGEGVFRNRQDSRILEKRLKSSGKSACSKHAAQPPEQPCCPECNSTRLYKDGLRYLENGANVQRWLCRNCGYRFSEPSVKLHILPKVLESSKPMDNLPHNVLADTNFPLKKTVNDFPLFFSKDVGSHGSTVIGQGLNNFRDYISNSRVCATRKGAKNLTEMEARQETGQREGTLQTADIKGLMTQYYAWLEKEGYCKESKYPKLILQLAKLGANLQDPEDVKTVIARQNWRNGTRILAVWAYDIMAQILKITWTRPKYTQEEILPFIPDESELDCLIATCKSRIVATYLQTLKETFADPGEALRLRWIDISENIITINMPVKRHNPRQIRVSNKLIAMLNALPKTSERIFPTTYRSLVSTFMQVRRRAANTQQNPRLLSISLTTFRHWGATMTYHYTKNILLVQKLLGHKNIKNTMKYTQLVHFKDDEYDVATATSVDEAKQLATAGFEKFDEFQSIHIFRKPKRFATIG